MESLTLLLIFPILRFPKIELYELMSEFSFGIITKLPPFLENSIIFFVSISGISFNSFSIINCCFKMLL